MFFPLQEIKRENRKKMADEDALRKIKYLEEQNYGLMRQINVHKQVKYSNSSSFAT